VKKRGGNRMRRSKIYIIILLIDDGMFVRIQFIGKIIIASLIASLAGW